MFGTPLESMTMKVEKTDNMDSVVSSFRRHVEDIVRDEYGSGIEIRILTISNGNNLILIPILVAGATA